MPILNGIEATKIIKEMIKNNQFPDIPIIAFTAFRSKQ